MATELRAIPGNEVALDAPMSEHTSFRIGGKADILVQPHTIEALAATMECAHRAGVSPVFLGGGTNVLVRDGGIRGVVVKIATNLSRVIVDGDAVRAEAGTRLASLCRESIEHGLSGLEFTAGIPGCVGGAVIMNAGTNMGDIGRVIRSVRVVEPDGSLVDIPREKLEFGYRSSSLQGSGRCVAEACFQLQKASPEDVHLALCEAIERRCGRQPLSHPSAGSVFKRPDGDYAGRLVEEAGAKGMRVGGAMISEKHANFIINRESATATDVLALIEAVRVRVHDQSGVWLQPEVCVLGVD